jgi:hypothetical protein
MERLFQSVNFSMRKGYSIQHLQAEMKNCLDDTSSMAVLSLLNDSWFTRGWVWQELVLSPEATFVIGQLTVLRVGLYWLTELAGNRICKGRDTGGDFQALTVIPTMMQAWADWDPSSHRSIHAPLPFHAILSRVAPYVSTTDPKDRVYTFLGLNRDPRIMLEPNYALSLEQVFITTAIAIISGTNNLDILNVAIRSIPGDHSSNLPSWVPHFGLVEVYTPWDWKWASQQGESKIGEIDLLRNSRRLKVRGRLIDRVSMVSGIHMFGRDGKATTVGRRELSVTAKVTPGDEIYALEGCASLVILCSGKDTSRRVLVETLSDEDNLIFLSGLWSHEDFTLRTRRLRSETVNKFGAEESFWLS